MSENFADILKSIESNQDKSQNLYYRGLSIISEILGVSNDFTLFDLDSSTKETLSKLIHRDNSLSLTELKQKVAGFIEDKVSVEPEINQSEEDLNKIVIQKKQEYLESAQAVFELVQPLFLKNIIRTKGLHNEFTNKETSEEMAKKAKLIEKRIGEANDLLQIIVTADDISEEETNEVIQMIEYVWEILTPYRDEDSTPQTFTVIVHDDQIIRDKGRMYENPSCTVLWTGDMNDALSIAAHETIHCAVGSQLENKYPLNSDFKEGMTTRIGSALNQDKETRGKAEQQPNLMRKYEKNLGIVSSRTQLIERAKIETNNQEELSYLFGYFLVEAILQSNRYRELSKGKKPYTTMIDLQRKLTWENMKDKADIQIGTDGHPKYSNREVIKIALDELDFDSNQIFLHTSDKIEAFNKFKNGQIND